MKLTYVFSLLLITMFLNACGPSAEEKRRIEQETASVTCSILGEPSNMGAAIRVEKMNDAREKIGGEPFLRGDDAIQEALEWGLCQELVLNKIYDKTLQPLKDAKRERERIAAEKLAEEQRWAEDQRIIIEEQKSPEFEKLFDDFGSLAEAFLEVKSCYDMRKGYAAVYVTDEAMSSAESKFKTKRTFYIKQSKAFELMEKKGLIDQAMEQAASNKGIFGRGGGWNEGTNSQCSLMLWAFSAL